MGCAIGSGDADDGGVPLVDTEPHVLDEGPPLEDSGLPPDAELEDVSEALDGDAIATDTGSTAADTAPIFDVDPDSCSATCKVCGETDGCGGTCKTGSCAGTSACVGGTCVAPTRSFLSPSSYPASWGAFAKGIDWTIASETASKIFYTTDGSTPGPTSANGASPLKLFLATDGTPLKWYADNGAKEGVQSFTVQISTALQTGYGYIVDDVKLDGTSPTVVVSPGTVINGNAKYQAWVSTACPGCREQIVYGIGTNAMGCLYDYSPSTWPGVSGTGTTKITAPSTPGVYKVRVAWALQLACSDALTTANPLGVKPTADIATIVVK